MIPRLLAIAVFVFDFMCIHPFRDGNGGVSRLAATLLLHEHGFHVARYISLERLVEESREEYYAVLEKCSVGWSEGANDVVPWLTYFLSTLRRAYKELEHQMESAGVLPAKSDLTRKIVMEQVEPFTLKDLSAQLPSVSQQLIKAVLSELKKQGVVRLAGRGRGARWEVIPPGGDAE